MHNNLAIIVVGVSNSGKTTTLREYCDYYKQAVGQFKKGWRYGISPYKPKFWMVKINAYVLAASPTETKIPLSDTIEPLEWHPELLLMPEQLNGNEYENSIDYLRANNYHIKEFNLSNVPGTGIWDRWNSTKQKTDKLLYRREEIADYIRNFINSRV